MSFDKAPVPLDLSEGLKDQEVMFPGAKYLYYLSGNVDIQIKYDAKTKPKVPFKPLQESTESWDCIYVTAPPAPVTITLYVSADPQSKMKVPTELLSRLSSNLNNAAFAVNNDAKIVWAQVSEVKEGLIRNWGDKTVYLGGAGVLTTNGFPLMPKESISSNYFNGNIYAVCDAEDTSDVRLLRAE